LADKATPTAFPFGFASGHAFGSLSFGRSKESEHEVLLSGRSERKCEGFPLGLARGEMPPAFLGIMAGKIFLWVQIARHSTER